MAWDDGQKYGRWEARVRSQKGNGYGPVMLLWPDAEDWPEDGEIDIMEIPKGDRTQGALHRALGRRQQAGQRSR